MIKKTLFIVIIILQVHLITATSHYSFDHAEELKSLINWREYTPATFEEAITENKPIFLLLTAPSWCYWCQVYESEEYLFHPDLVTYINQNTIPIYVDADQRQDLTRKYLEGGWPSTTILTPNRQRLFGFSGPRPVDFMISNLQNAYNHIQQQGFTNQKMQLYEKETPYIPSRQDLDLFVNRYASFILQSHDPVNGGFGTGQKFPQGRSLDFCLDLYQSTGNPDWLSIVETTLQNQYTNITKLDTDYNLFDPVEGGFHRYGTQPNWTPPHFEKMLYDNARLLKVYFHLSTISPDNDIALEVVSKTLVFINENWYDPEGGFYANSDVHGEDHYYGNNPRPLPKARVEKTKFASWNGEAILSYLYLYQTSQNETYKSMLTQTLDFYETNLISDEGVYHYVGNTSRGVRGSLLDNSYALLTFIEAYEVLDDPKYLATATKIADYSLETLYDWYGGGFFERHSQDRDLYAPGEEIDFSKPTEENGVITYALLKLYSVTNNIAYLNAAMKTFGLKINDNSVLDRAYYFALAAQYINLNEQLLNDYQSSLVTINLLEKENQMNYWVNDFIAPEPIQQDFIFEEEKTSSPFFFLLFIALIAGFLSFASPCSLPILPAYVAYTLQSSKKNIVGMTFSFFAGLSLIFVLLGMSSTFVGKFLKSNITTFSQISGIILVILGILLLLGKGLPALNIKKRKPTTYLGSFGLGIILGISWTPCVGPILIALLVLASSASYLGGGLLLFFYSLGLSIPLFIAAFYLQHINQENRLWKIIKGKEITIFGKTIHTTPLFSGLLFILLGYLIFSGKLTIFNQFLAASPFQKWIFHVEEWLLGLVN